MLGDGLRQITELVLPGDICHPHIGLVAADYSFSTLSPCTLAEIDPAELASAVEDYPDVRRALRWSTLQAESILREMVTNNGRRLATARIAHLICEVFARLRAAGVLEGNNCAWPLTQEALSEVTSMTSVHVNRSLKALRDAGLIVPKHHVMRVPSIERLEEFCGFRPDYRARLRATSADCAHTLKHTDVTTDRYSSPNVRSGRQGTSLLMTSSPSSASAAPRRNISAGRRPRCSACIRRSARCAWIPAAS
ncbi:Crp/Fnr family transcriptional regulator [Methylobacterium sp. P31]